MVKQLETRGKASSLSFATVSRYCSGNSLSGLDPTFFHFSYKDPGHLTAKHALHLNAESEHQPNLNWGENRQGDNGQPCQGLEATQLQITLMEVLHPVSLLLAPFMWNIMSLSAWPLRQNEEKRGATLCQMVQRNEDSIRLTDPLLAF